MSANLEAKKEVVSEIKDKLSKAKTVVFVDYRGLTVAEDTAMRNEFRKHNADYKVYKNRLVRLAPAAVSIICVLNEIIVYSKSLFIIAHTVVYDLCKIGTDYLVVIA